MHCFLLIFCGDTSESDPIDFRVDAKTRIEAEAAGESGEGEVILISDRSRRHNFAVGLSVDPRPPRLRYRINYASLNLVKK